MIKAIIIDDECIAVKHLAILLKEYYSGEQVVNQCSDADDGLKSIAKFNPDLMFLDIEMPGMYGFDML